MDPLVMEAVKTYGLNVLVLVSILLVGRFFVWALKYVSDEVVRPYQIRQEKIAAHQASAQASMSVTASSLHETMRESRVMVELLKEVHQSQRDVLSQLRDQAEKRSGPEPDRNAQ